MRGSPLSRVFESVDAHLASRPPTRTALDHQRGALSRYRPACPRRQGVQRRYAKRPMTVVAMPTVMKVSTVLKKEIIYFESGRTRGQRRFCLQPSAGRRQENQQQPGLSP